MSYKYTVKRNIDKSGTAEKVQYYATAISSGIVSTRELAEILSVRSSLTVGDVVSTLIGLSELVQEKLQQGYKVAVRRHRHPQPVGNERRARYAR